MIVSCPACATRFSLDAALLGDAGRSVRCAKCSHKWKQLPPKLEHPGGQAPEATTAIADDAGTAGGSAAAGADGQVAAQAEPAVEIPAAPPRPRTPQRPTGPITVPPKLRPMVPKRRLTLLPLYLLGGIFIGLLAAAFVFRAEIARAVPALDVVYSLVGLSTSNPAEDLEIGNLVFKRRNEDGTSLISVQAEVFNQSEFPVKLPGLVAIPYDGEKNQLEPSHVFRLQEDVIEPGETLTFRTLFENPPSGTKSLRVSFIQ